MNGNYEFVRQVARDKQSALAKEARDYRKAKRTGQSEGRRFVITVFATAGGRLRGAVNWAAKWSAGLSASWRSALHGTSAATR